MLAFVAWLELLNGELPNSRISMRATIVGKATFSKSESCGDQPPSLSPRATRSPPTAALTCRPPPYPVPTAALSYANCRPILPPAVLSCQPPPYPVTVASLCCELPPYPALFNRPLIPQPEPLYSKTGGAPSSANCRPARHYRLDPYRGTSLIRNSADLGPYSRPMPRALWWS